MFFIIDQPLEKDDSLVEKSINYTGCMCSNRCTVARECPCKHAQTLCSLLCHPGHLCTNLRKDSIADEVIDVDMLKSKLRKPKQKWMQVERVVLHETHKQMLTSNHEWFDDCIISAAQSLLKQKYPDIRGLQSPTLAETLSFEQALDSPYLQVLLENKNHWIVISTVGCPPNTVRIFDSMNSNHLSSANKKLVADILRTDSDFITLEYVHVQYQIGASDCGAFAIAFATSICFSEDPHLVMYEQCSLRSHLRNCLEKGKMEKFPKRKHIRLTTTDTVVKTKLAVYCICRLPNDGKPMIKCSKCKKWHHSQCVNLNLTDLDELKSSQWNCYMCAM